MISRDNIADVYPLSPLQEGMLFHANLTPGSGAYTEQLSVTLAGRLDVPSFEQAWSALAKRHAVLRTAIEWEIRREPFQIVLRKADPRLRCEDWRDLAADEQERQLESLRLAERSRGFDLSRPPLLRLVLVRTAEQAYELVWTFHHILLDGWSASILMSEQLALYEAALERRPAELPRARPFREFVLWVRRQDLGAAERFWRRSLAGVTAPTSLPLTRPGREEPAAASGAGECEIEIEAGGLQAFAQRARLTLSTLVQGAWALLLARASGERDVVFGNTVSGRGGDLPGSESMVGLLINTLPVRARVEPEQDLVEWLAALQAQQAEARQHEHVPLVRIQEWSEIPRGLPLFESLVVFENYPVSTALTGRLSAATDLAIDRVRLVEETHYPLSLVAVPGERLTLKLVYDSRRIDRHGAERLLGRLARLLARMAGERGAKLADIDPLEPWERHQLLVEWNDTAPARAPGVPVHRQIEEQAERTPDAVALGAEDRWLTYGELNRRASRLADHLRSLDVGPEVRVGLAAGRSLEMVLGALAVLKTGGAYVPLDPSHPRELLMTMIADAGASLVLAGDGPAEALSGAGFQIVRLDAGGRDAAAARGRGPRIEISPESAACVLYTPGPAGDPRGVVVRHAGLAHLWHRAGPGFDATVRELWPYLACGAALQGAPAPPAGRPIEGARAYLVDPSWAPVRPGAAGEILIGGELLARGYLGRPDLTAAAFIPDPFGGDPGARLYRTGDLGRYRSDGCIEWLGRRDRQVRLRGARVEPGEIENALLAHPRVREAVVTLRDDGPEARLVAYFVALAAQPTAAELAAFLRRRLPEAIVPEVYVLLASMPVKPDGTVDLRRLPAPDRSGAPRVAARTPVERLLCDALAQILGTGPIGIEDDFFTLGGHSLHATQVIARCRSLFEIDLPVRALFEDRTVAAVALRIEEMRRAGARPAAPPLTRIARDGDLPLSHAQQRMWFLDRLQPDSPVYNIPLAVRLTGDLDPRALAAALCAETARQESLRTSFGLRGGNVVQVIAPALRLDLPVIDLSSLPAAARQRESRRILAVEAGRTFDLERGPLVRALLLRLDGSEEHVLLLVLHHIIADGWSMGVLVHDLATLYDAISQGRPSPLRPLPVQYVDYAVWQRRWLEAGALEAQLAFWRQRLAGAPPVLDLPTDRPRPAVQTFRGRRAPFVLESEASEALRGFCQAEGATLFMALLAAFKALLTRYIGEEDVVVGSLIANRTAVETESLIGLFVNTQVLRTDLSGDPALRVLLGRVRATVLEAFSYQDLPFEDLVAAVAPPRDLSRTPLFQIAFTLQEARLEDLALPQSVFSPVEVQAGSSRFDLGADLMESRAGVSGSFEYSTDLFDETTVLRMGHHLAGLLKSALADPGRRLSELSVLTPAEHHQIRCEWNDTAEPGHLGACLHELLAEQAQRAPGDVAVELAGQPLSYGELNRRANRLAWSLRARGIGPGVRVGLSVERSLETLVGLWAVLKAGGAYVPLDPALPRERLAFILEDAGIELLLTQPRLSAALPAHRLETLSLEDLPAIIAGQPDDDPVSVVGPSDLAYVIYTSGSTGRPKGVLVPHRGLLNLVHAQRATFALGPGSRVLQLASLSFDFSWMEIALPLGFGGQLIAAADDTLTSEEGLAGFLAEHAIDMAVLPPSLLATLPEDRLPALTTIVAGGEAVGPELVARWSPGRNFYNAYGPTESTVWTNIGPCNDGRRRPPIGRPIANVRTVVLGRRRELLPAGVPGELAIGGEALAWGYLHRPDLTADRFIPDPLSPTPGSRLYRTGDLVRFLPDGSVDFLGRIDHQIKVRGFRIEPGEIEAVLARHPAVREAVVLAREPEPGRRQIVAYVAAEQPDQLDLGELRVLLREHLPEYMLPAAIVPLAAMPRTVQGKVDRRALPDPGGERSSLEASGAPPTTPAEKILAAVWQNVLGRERVGVRDNFFELGGDSILSLTVVARAAEAGLKLSARQIFEHQTIAELAALAVPLGADAEMGPVSGPVPLTPIESWFFEQGFAAPHHWNQALLLEVRDGVPPGLLAGALAHLVTVHEAFRLRFRRSAAGIEQLAAPPEEATPELARVDLSAVPETLLWPVIEAAATSLQGTLDFGRGPLLRAAWFGLGAGRPARLLLVIHHLAVDAVSWRILLADLETACAQLLRGEAVRLPRQTTSFLRWAGRLAEHARSPEVAAEAGFWLAGEWRDARSLPRDFSGGDNTVAASDAVTISLSREETRTLLAEVAPAARAQVHELLLTALARACGRVLGQDSLLVEVEGHGREELFEGVDLSRTVGWFTAVFPLRLDTRAGDPGAALRSTKHRLRRVPRRGIGYGLLRYLGGDPEVRAALAALPQADVSFNYLGQLDAGSAMQGLFRLAPEPPGPPQEPANRRRHLLEVGALVLGGELEVTLRYSRRAHRRGTVEALGEEILQELHALALLHQTSRLSGLVPADFPLAALEPEELDALVAAHRGIEDIYPLSPLQQGLLFHHRLEAGAGEYLVQLTCRLSGALDATALREAWQLALERHPALRTCFVGWELRAEPLQIVLGHVELPWTEEDWRELAREPQAELWSARLDADRRQGFDVSRAPLLRLRLVRTGESEHRLLATFHHLLLDGWSLGQLFKEVLTAYAALAAGRAPALAESRPYRAYISWLQHQDLSSAESYWTRSLAGFTAPTALPLARPSAPVTDDRGPIGERAIRLPAGVTAALRTAAARQQLTLNTLLEAAWALLLGRSSGEPEVVFGATTSGRPPELPGVESMIGLFINSLPVRVGLPADQPLRLWLEALQARQAEARQYEHSPLVLIHGWSEVPRSRPLFESLLVYENYPLDTSAAGQVHGLTIDGIGAVERSHYPLTLVIAPGDELHVKLLYERARFEDVAALRLLEHFGGLLEELAVKSADPHTLLDDISLLTAPERQQLLIEWNDTRSAFADLPVHRLFTAVAAQRPDAVALVCGSVELTYRELDDRTDRLARGLCASGVGPESLVAVFLERSERMMTALLAVLKAGGAYVPLDPDWPRARVNLVLQQAGATAVLTELALAERLPAQADHVLCLEDLGAEAAEPDVLPAVTADSLAYVLFTSGSLGTPKGVAVTHRSIVRLVCGVGYVDLRPDDVFLQLAPVSFDASTFEIWGALLNGARLVVMPPGPVALSELGRTLASQQISTLWLTAGLFHLAVDERLEDFAGVRQLLAGGDVLSVQHVRRALAARSTGRLINGYGPTEATTFTCCHAMADPEPAGTSVPIGRPIDNTAICLLDDGFRPVPAGAAGELYIAGPGLARCYLGDPGLTAAKFVPDPLSGVPGARLYRSGDLARYLQDGRVEFLGRRDLLVKIRGFRIELGEIETALGRHPAVREAVTVALQDSLGDKRLVAYIVAEPGATVTAAVLREYLEEWLPSYMVPSAFVFLPAFPLNANGKTDRKALPAPERAGEATFVPPRTPTEELLANLWCELLGVEQVGVYDSFFDLGGHSLLATRLMARIHEVFGIELPIRQLFEEPTLAPLAEALDTARHTRGTYALPPITRVPRDGELPLSFSQERLWFLDQLSPGSPLYNIPVALRLAGGPLDVGVLKRSLDRIVRRHEALRTTFKDSGGRPVQVISAGGIWPLPVNDLSQLPAGERIAEAERLAREEISLPFDLRRFPLLRTRLLRLSAAEHVLLLVLHHIVADGWSIRLLLDELVAGYSQEGPPLLPELPVQYADFAHWQRKHVRGEYLDRHLAYWRKHLAGAPGLLELPADHPRPAVQSFRGAARTVDLAPDLVGRLRAFCRREGVTPFMALLAAFQGLLARASGRLDIVVGSPIANRTRSEIERLIGFFVNTLALRLDLSGSPGFGELVRRVREAALGAFTHQDLPFERLVDDLQPQRDLSHMPVFQVMFSFQDAVAGSYALPGITVEPVAVPTSTAKFDLVLELVVAGEEIHARWEHNTDLFAASTIARMAGHFEVFLAAALASPRQPFGELPLLGDGELHQIAHEWNDTRAAYPSELTFHGRFAALAKRQPERIALSHEGRLLTYGELDARANQLAHRLRAMKVEPGMRVGIGLDRNLELAVGILGVLKAGAVYLPLDPAYPQDRLEFMVDDARLAVLLTQESLLDTFPEPEGPTLCLDSQWSEIAVESREDPAAGVTAAGPAYIIYTSGSTGRPKGVVVAHRGLSNLVEAQVHTFGLSPDDHVLQFSSLSFDASVFDVAMALGVGSTLYLAPQETLLPGPDLVAYLRARSITNLTLPPSALEAVPRQELPALGAVVVAGEACSAELAEAWSPGRRFFNAYGPTEATIWSTVRECGPGSGRPPIGRPIDNTRTLVLDAHLQLLPIGVPGELYLSGAGLALGYLHRPELTAERFVPDPCGEEPGARLYRTGDLVRHLPDGSLDFLGRVDSQVKVRGFRIELGEIESVLAEHPGVARAVVMLRVLASGNQRLVAYVVPERRDRASGPAGGADAPPVEAAELAFFLRQRLPAFMLPQSYVVLDAFPLTPNGKVDRQRLPAPDEGRASRFVAPRTPVEEILVGIWADLLKLERVGVQDNFFELGGHSLLATQLVSRVREAFQVDLPLRGLFEAATVAALAERVEAALQAEQGVAAPPIRPRSRAAAAPLSFAQQRLWFLSQLEPESPAYNLPAILRLEGTLDVPAFEGAVGEIVRRHEILRTNFVVQDREPVQIVQPVTAWHLPLVDLAGIPAEHRRREVRRLARQDAGRPFDLSRDRLLRMTLLGLGPGENIALVNLHHIVSDGWSTDILNAEMGLAYQALSAGRPSPLPALPVQYADYAEWQRGWLTGEVLETQLAYWRKQLANRPPEPAGIPAGRRQAPHPTHRGERLLFTIDPQVAEALGELCRKEGVTMFMVLLAALDTLLYRYTRQEDVVVGAHIANRNRAEIEGLIGFFVNILVLRNDLSGKPTFTELLQRVRQTTMDAYTHQDTPFERLVEELQPQRDMSHNPLFRVAFNFTGRSQGPPPPASGPNDLPLVVNVVEPEETLVRFDFMLAMSQDPAGLKGSWEYSTDLYEAETVQRVQRHFLRLLESIAIHPEELLDGLAMLSEEEAEQQQQAEETSRAAAYERFKAVKPKRIKAV